MAIHVAILKTKYVELILCGRKTVESRLYRTKMPPVGQVVKGERVYIKHSGGPFAAIARVGEVEEYTDLTPGQVDKLAARYNDTVCGDAAYWEAKRASRFAVFVSLCEVQPIEVGPKYVASMRAWHVLGDAVDVIREYIVTEGALRNGYARLTGASDKTKRDRLHLQLPDCTWIETELTKGTMFRWRGWKTYYQRHHIKPGDKVRFVALGQQRYRVCFET